MSRVVSLTGVTCGGIGAHTGLPPSAAEYDNIARALEAAVRHAKSKAMLFGIEPVNRYEIHLINTGAQAKWMIEKVGVDNMSSISTLAI